MLKRAFILFLTSFLLFLADLQAQDTSYYNKDQIKMISKSQGERIEILTLFDLKGNVILSNGEGTYNFKDPKTKQERCLVLSGHFLKEEFWKRKQEDGLVDSVYNYIPFDKDFKMQFMRFQKFILSHLKYPSEALKEQRQGMVIMRFVVDKKGFITQLQPLTQLGFGMEQEAKRLVMQYAAWGMIYQDQRPIHLQLEIPIRFSLSTVKN